MQRYVMEPVLISFVSLRVGILPENGRTMAYLQFTTEKLMGHDFLVVPSFFFLLLNIPFWKSINVMPGFFQSL